MEPSTEARDADWLAGRPVPLPAAAAAEPVHPQVHALHQALEQLQAARYWSHTDPAVAAACEEAVAAIAEEIRHHTDTPPNGALQDSSAAEKETSTMSAGETTITVIGNLTADPELRFTPGGAAVANFTVASTPRTFDRPANEWKDGETLFLRGSVWREQAENVAESLTKGMRVIVSGRLKSRSYETKEGEKRTVIELEVDEIGPSLRYANAKISRAQRGTTAPAAEAPQGSPTGWGGREAEPPF